jgi:hypothetical protein
VKHGFSLRRLPKLGWMPGPMPEEVQKALAERLAGGVMGAGAKKGYTYRWIPNHLQDAQTKVVPRSILVLIGQAAKEALKHPLSSGHRLITPQDLVAALIETSHRRVGEIQEEYKLVNRLKHLTGSMLLLSQEEVIERIAQPVEGEPPGLSTDGRAVFDELVRLGVLAVRSNGRVDVPDIYRFGFGVLRKGGVARPR